MIIEITQNGSSLRRNHESFLISTKETSDEIPAEKVDAIIISANSSITSQAIKLCIERQIQLVFTDYGGKPFGRIWTSTYGNNVAIRRLQYLNQESNIANKHSLKISVLKIKKQLNFLKFLINNRNEQSHEINKILEEMSYTLKKIKSIIPERLDKASLRGMEGYSAQLYFSALSSLLPEKWKFKYRSQHPALDPFNAALNYLYGIGYTTVEKIILLSGLDPNAGLFHSDSYSKPTLSFDLIEIIRPDLDSIIFPLFSKRIAKESWFEIQESPHSVFLSKECRFKIIELFRKHQKDMEKEIWEFCRELRKDLGSI